MNWTKRGIFFSTDALIALMIIFLIILISYEATTYQRQTTELHYDIIKSLSALKVGEISNDRISTLISQGKITNMNKTILEEIGDLYIENTTEGQLLAQDILNSLKTKSNIGIWYGSDLLASINSTSFETATNVDVARQTISGIQKGSPATGYVSKAWLKKIDSKQTSTIVRGDMMCGGWSGSYCGTEDTNATYTFYIPENATIKNATWLAEPVWVGEYEDLYVNGVKVYGGSVGDYVIVDISSKLHPGNNTAKVRGQIGAEDGASHITINYETPDLQTFFVQTRFPFNEVSTKSVLYHEKALFPSNPISTMKIQLNVTAPTEVSIRKRDKTIILGTKTPVNGMINFSNSEISSALAAEGINYSDLNDEYFFVIAKVGVSQAGQYVKLGQNSYIDFEYGSQTSIPFGSIDITSEIKVNKYSNSFEGTFYGDIAWAFSLPTGALPVLADWQFGWITGGGGPEQVATANNVVLYSSPPQPFIYAFNRFGYTPFRASGLFNEGQNNFTLHFGPGYGVSTEASYGSLTYFVKSFVGYGQTKPKAKGGTRIVQFADGSTSTLVIGDGTDIWDPANDSVDDAVERLLQQLDTNNDGKIDLTINTADFSVNSLDISGVPYLWSTEVQVRTWY